jgi:hypothetical protein
VPTPYVSPMGQHLKGWSPPFTDTGKSAYWPIAGNGYPGVQPIHNGIFIRFEADPEELAKLLPLPLVPNERTKEAAIFINQTILLPAGLTDLSEVEPDATRFQEALIVFPCEMDGRELAFHYIQYTDSDWCAYCGPLSGLTTKMSDIRLLTPTPTDHPNWGLDKPGSLIKASVSRDGERLITATFTMGEELEDASKVFDIADIVGMRYFPDMTNRTENRPLVHDLVLQNSTDIDPGRAYAGTATLSFGSTTTDELHYFTPKRIIEAHYLTGMSHHNQYLTSFYDYLKEN